MGFIISLVKHLATPALFILAVFLLEKVIQNFSDSVLFLLAYLPYFFFSVSALLCVQFNQSRMLFALVSLFLLYVILHSSQFSVFRLFEFVLVFWALINIAVLAQMPERSVLSVHSVLKIMVMLVQVLVTWYLLAYQFLLVEKIFFSTTLPAPPVWMSFSWLLLAAVCVAMLSTLIKFIIRPGPIGAALSGFVFMLLMLLVMGSSQILVICLGLAMAILTFIAVLFDSHQMAYRDELTGLRSRRALNQYLTGLGRKYSIAMIDIDHFKKFNDNHGHDIGDQMLKLVASRIARVGGGGTPFRYGGEEFTVVFPRKETDDVMDTLEALRESIQGYPLVIRAKDRPKKAPKKTGKKKANDKTSEILTCTISIGIANRADELKTPEQVIKGADQALYRAKEKGRNCLSV